jgi:hypothetical protein
MGDLRRDPIDVPRKKRSKRLVDIANIDFKPGTELLGIQDIPVYSFTQPGTRGKNPGSRIGTHDIGINIRIRFILDACILQLSATMGIKNCIYAEMDGLPESEFQPVRFNFF